MKNIMKTRIFITAIIMVSHAACTPQSYDLSSPLLRVYVEGHLPVETVTVSVTNPRKDAGILVTSVEFDGQLPGLRYFHHGIYGSISKKGANYEHYPWVQQLTMPVGSCFLLPGQSASWQRSLRVLNEGYKAKVTWRVVPKEEIPTSVWFESKSTDGKSIIYEPLSRENEVLYSNIAAARRIMPYTILPGDFQSQSKTSHVACVGLEGFGRSSSETLEGFPKGSVELSLEHISESIIVTEDIVFIRKYNRAKKKYETIDSPDFAPPVMDLLYLSSRSKDQTVPCILASTEFNDLIDVKEPFTNMYYNPGITQVPLKLFPKILARARERNLSVEIKSIDPNSLGKQHVITIGVDVNSNGRQKTIQPVATANAKKLRR